MGPNNTLRHLVQGIPTRELVDGIQPARVGDEEVLVVKRGTEVFAIGAHCTHYHGPRNGETVIAREKLPVRGSKSVWSDKHAIR